MSKKLEMLKEVGHMAVEKINHIGLKKLRINHEEALKVTISLHCGFRSRCCMN